jgi:transglutaminase-like putative cysteine protease
MNQYLTATSSFDFDKPQLQAYADSITAGATDPVKIATWLYYAVRDDIRYNPYVFSSNPKTFSASYCLESRESYCIPKAVLLGALGRYKGIPTRLGLANVKNHLSSPQLIDYLRSEVFVMHGYTEFFLDNRWVKATPAFNKRLCHLMKVAPLEFNGRDDSIFHEFGDDGHRHMEYLADHGQFSDVPYEFIMKAIAEAYPHLAKDGMVESMNQHSLAGDLS